MEMLHNLNTDKNYYQKRFNFFHCQILKVEKILL
jgi:hypothetical protein